MSEEEKAKTPADIALDEYKTWREAMDEPDQGEWLAGFHAGAAAASSNIFASIKVRERRDGGVH